jgi:hypothetical protein
VTVKIRKLRTWEDTIRTVLALQEAGASIITVHGRLKENIKERINTCDWDVIRRIKAHPDVRVPIFANGGIGCHEDVQACLAYTGADGVMSSEALLENPGLFSDGYRTLPGTSVRVTDRRSDAVDFAFEYLDIAEHYDEDPGAIRGHLMKMLFAPLKMHTALRNRLLGSHTIPEWRSAVGEVARMFGHRRAAAADDAALAVVKASCFLQPSQYAALVRRSAASLSASATSAAEPATLAGAGAGAGAATGAGSSCAADAGAGAPAATLAAVVGPAAPEGAEWLRCDILRPRAGGFSSALQQRKEKNNRKNAERKDKKLAAKQAKLARKQEGAAGTAGGGAGAGAGSCGGHDEEEADEAEEQPEGAGSDAQARGGSVPTAASGDCCSASFAAYSAAAHEGEGGAADPAAAATADDSQPPAKRRRVGGDGGADASSAASSAAAAAAAAAQADGGAAEGAGAVPVPATAADHSEAAAASAGAAAAGASKGRDDPAAVAAAAAAAAEAQHLLATTDWASFTGRRAVEADWEEWRATRSAGPSCGYSKPDFLVDPLQPGLWYMRHQSGAASATAGRYAGRCGRKDGPQGFLSLIERPAANGASEGVDTGSVAGEVSTAAGAVGSAESVVDASYAAAAAVGATA